ncbi:hypothetical protein B0H13DRAFT_1881759 [Mycena leptocephala]|nr:hypothetical protein B0H13DRAFT_1881759 [Mycena leptocephala]
MSTTFDVTSRVQSTRVRILANGKETALPGGPTEWIQMHKSLGMQTPSRELLPFKWYESVRPASTKWPKSGWMGGFSLNEMKDDVDAMKSVSVDFAPNSACRILDIDINYFWGESAASSSPRCDKNGENLHGADGSMELKVQLYQRQQEEGRMRDQRQALQRVSCAM